MKNLLLLNGAGATVFTLLVREEDEVTGAPLRNLEGVQPIGNPLQAAFGDGLAKAGRLERVAGLCDTSAYASTYDAKAALEAALVRTSILEVDGWRLPLAAVLGIESWALVLGGFKVTLSFLPASAYWRLMASARASTGSQTGHTVTGGGFTAGEVGRLIVFNNGMEARIVGFTSTSSVQVDTDQAVSNQAFATHAVVTGLL